VPVVTALSRYLFSVLREGERHGGMTLVLEDPGGEAATQCLRRERVAGIPGRSPRA
jgi:hypothetical protein